MSRPGRVCAPRYPGAVTVQQPAAAKVPVQSDRAVAAFFDVDNTVVIGASIFHFAKGLAARKFFRWHDLVRFAVRQARLRLRGEAHRDMRVTRESALVFIAGKDVGEIVALGEQIYDEELANRLWLRTVELAREHVRAGERVWLVTATPVELATIIARRLGLTGALGTVAEVKGGRYTGRLVGELMHGEAKAQAVRALAEREGLDLSRCTAYSDSANDLPMLTLCGSAVAVNPDTELRAVARSRGWTVRDFRTGRKAAKIGVPTVAAAVLSGGIVGGTIAVRRRRKIVTVPVVEKQVRLPWR